ncbi:unannotated protein [freshwater metagenome]|uniref:Unannotated protein n=1 Tax=freshwater metagenome TaxID=449393 RepID=A0A6J6FGL7_9ZZZZ
MSLGVGGERCSGIEPHRLRSQQTDEERGGVVDLEPRRHVHEQRERNRVRFGEPEVRKGLERAVDLVRGHPGDAVGRHPGVELFPNRREPFDAAFRPDGTSNDVGVGSAAPTDCHRDLHELLLKDGNTHGSFEDGNEVRVVVRDGFLSRPAANERMNTSALNRTGTNHRDLNDEVVEASRAKPGE